MGREFIIDSASFSSLDEAYEQRQLKQELKDIDQPVVVEDVVDEECEEEVEDEEDYDDDPVIRAKWTIDGASTLDEAIEKLYEFIDYLRSLQTEGWELRDTIDDDYGFLKKVR